MPARTPLLLAAASLLLAAPQALPDEATPTPDPAFEPNLSFRDASPEPAASWPDTPIDDTLYREPDLSLSKHLLLAQADDAPTPDTNDAGESEFEQGEMAPEQVSTGTDPRDFANKLMPYYRYMKLENDIEIQQLTIFGLYAFSPKVAMTYELPLMSYIDYSDFGPFEDGTGGFPPGNGAGTPGGGVPLDDLESDGDVIGVGDLILRFFARIDALKFVYDENTGKSIEFMPTIETTLPTATNDVIGGETWILSPAVTVVMDIPGGPPFGLGFIAAMNFFDFDVVKDSKRDQIRRYRGRIFWMQPLSKPGPNIFDGLYVLTEMQPIYDFETDHFSFWIGPEFGKIIREGLIIYAKPGWGISPDADFGDRQFTFEAGLRYFF